MNLDDVVVKGKPSPISPSEIESLESSLGINFPEGYREIICKFGEGWLDDLRIYPPNRIQSGTNNINEWRNRIDEYWFWDEEPVVISKARALESIVFADTSNGDEFIFHPSQPNAIYILPRDSERAILVEGGLFKALEWYSTSDFLVEAFKTWTFEPFVKPENKAKKQWWKIWK